VPCWTIGQAAYRTHNGLRIRQAVEADLKRREALQARKANGKPPKA
jgi:hypothetical protein